jgi:hypothetical protein
VGDSVGHREGDTLVVDTTNFNDETRFRGLTENLHVIERFTRVDANTLLYRLMIEDPDTWDRAWSGEYTWPATDKPIYEYACHEGNYAGAWVPGDRTPRKRTSKLTGSSVVTTLVAGMLYEVLPASGDVTHARIRAISSSG